MLITFLFCIFGYLTGSISTAVLVCRLKKLPDPRTVGSHNPGATNVVRIGGKGLALMVVLGDALKGYLPVLCAAWFGLEGFGLSLVAVSAVLGHVFPIFFHFKGGKGVATTFGALLALSGILALLLIATWIVVFVAFRYSSLAAIVTTILAPFYAYWFTPPSYLPAILFLSALVLIRHQKNVQQLLAGKEK